MAYQYQSAGMGDTQNVTIALWAYVTSAAIAAVPGVGAFPVWEFGVSKDPTSTFAGTVSAHTYDIEIEGAAGDGGFANGQDSPVLLHVIGEAVGVVWHNIPADQTGGAHVSTPGGSGFTGLVTPGITGAHMVTTTGNHGEFASLDGDYSGVTATGGFPGSIGPSGFTVTLDGGNALKRWGIHFDAPAFDIFADSEPRYPSSLSLFNNGDGTASIQIALAKSMPSASFGDFDFQQYNFFFDNSLRSFILDSWNHIFFSVDNGALTWSLIVNGADQTSPSDAPFLNSFDVALASGQIGLPVTDADFNRSFHNTDEQVRSSNSQQVRYAYVQMWFNQTIVGSPGNLENFFTIQGDRIVPPANVNAAQNAFGDSDVYCYRDRNAGVKFQTNNGTSGAFANVGTAPVDFTPGPGQGAGFEMPIAPFMGVSKPLKIAKPKLILPRNVKFGRNESMAELAARPKPKKPSLHQRRKLLPPRHRGPVLGKTSSPSDGIVAPFRPKGKQ